MNIRFQLKIKCLSWLLYHGNQNPLHLKQEFYEIKSGLLQIYGKQDGFDLQELPGVRCKRCSGTGWYSSWSECYCCAGTGLYSQMALVPLKRYFMGDSKYIFHVPVERYEKGIGLPFYYDKPPSKRINGLIRKERTPYSQEARLWLFLLYRPTCFWWMWHGIVRFDDCDKGVLVGIHKFIRYCKDEMDRRSNDLDYTYDHFTEKACIDDEIPF